MPLTTKVINLVSRYIQWVLAARFASHEMMQCPVTDFPAVHGYSHTFGYQSNDSGVEKILQQSRLYLGIRSYLTKHLEQFTGLNRFVPTAPAMTRTTLPKQIQWCETPSEPRFP